MYYKEYTPAVLQKIQSIDRMMLSDFNALCKKYHIDYFGGAGTGIGAVRHQGMIPWDDDIDVYLTRPDFERFLEVAEKEYGDKYVIVNAERDIRYPLMSTRWVLRGTVFRDFEARVPWEHQGFFLDVYCMENLADDEKKARRQYFWAWFWGKLMTLRLVPSPTHPYQGLRGKLLTMTCRCASLFLRLFTSQRFLIRQVKRYSLAENHHPTERLAFFFDTDLYVNIISRTQMFPTREVPFDDVTIRIPADVDAYLKHMFGDYMKMPPPEKRHNHPPLELDFGPYGPCPEEP